MKFSLQIVDLDKHFTEYDKYKAEENCIFFLLKYGLTVILFKKSHPNKTMQHILFTMGFSSFGTSWNSSLYTKEDMPQLKQWLSQDLEYSVAVENRLIDRLVEEEVGGVKIVSSDKDQFRPDFLGVE